MRAMIGAVLLMVALGSGTRAAAQEGEEAGAPGAIDAAAIEQGVLRYRGEPPVARVVELALAQRSASPGRVRDAMDRARASGALPIARAGLRRGQTVDLRGLGAGTIDELTNVSTDEALTFEASLIFRLDRLVYAPEERALLAELRSTEAERERLTTTVIAVYYERRRVQLERDLAGRLDVVRALRLLELEALLDAFTAGAFTRMIRGSPP